MQDNIDNNFINKYLSRVLYNEIPYKEIRSLLKNSEFEKYYENKKIEFKEYVSRRFATKFIDYFPECPLTIIFDDDNQMKFNFKFEELYESLLFLLSIKEYKDFDQAISILETIKNVEELKINFPELYDTYCYFKKCIMSQVEFIELENKILAKSSFNNSEYINLMTYVELKKYIRYFVDFTKKMLKNDSYNELSDWCKNNPFNFEFNEKEKKKIFLYVLFKKVEDLSFVVSNNDIKEAQKTIIFIENFLKNIPENIEKIYFSIHLNNKLNDSSIYGIDDKNKITLNYQKIMSAYQHILNKNDFLKQNLEFDKKIFDNIDLSSTDVLSVNYINYIFDAYIDNIIEKNILLGSEEIDGEVIEEKIRQIEEELNNENLSKKEKTEKEHQLQKLKMVYKEIKPKAIQKGIGAFKGYNVYYYSNGMVAIDKIAYGRCLYAMPISIYKYVIENDIKPLTPISKITGVERFRHDLDSNWLDKAKNYILNGCNLITEEDIKISEEIVSWDFDYTEDDIDKLDEIIQKINDNENYTEKQKKEKIENINIQVEKKKREHEKILEISKKIDDELLTSNPEIDLKESDKKEIENYEDILDKEFGLEFDFIELYNSVRTTEQKMQKKYKRNPAVSYFTKVRSIDENGNYCCELCGDKDYRFKIFQSHHIIPISEGGPDNIYNTICLCPTCHTTIHLEPERITKSMKSKMIEILRKHIYQENPEYLEQFENMFGLLTNKYRKELESLKSEVEQLQYYEQNKKILDELFELSWHIEKENKTMIK